MTKKCHKHQILEGKKSYEKVPEFSSFFKPKISWFWPKLTLCDTILVTWTTTIGCWQLFTMLWLQNLPFFGRCLYTAHWSVYCRQRKSVYHVKWINVPLSQSDNRNDTHITMYMPYHGVKANLKWPLKSQRLTILWDYSKLSFWIGLVLVCKLSKLWQNQK